MSRKYLLIALLLAATPAFAFDASQLGQGGSLPLSDLNPLINQSTQLKQEVSDALAAINKPADAVICGGNRFPGQWDHLGGLRAAPYICVFSGKWLLLGATVQVAGANGQVYDTITPDAMKNAVRVTETNPTWKWTATDPFAAGK